MSARRRQLDVLHEAADAYLVALIRAGRDQGRLWQAACRVHDRLEHAIIRLRAKRRA
jgi:hypothetical protein